MTDAEWPEKAELERWLMNTVKDPDPGAVFLRQVLQMNPAYGSYLQTDKDVRDVMRCWALSQCKRLATAAKSSKLLRASKRGDVNTPQDLTRHPRRWRDWAWNDTALLLSEEDTREQVKAMGACLLSEANDLKRPLPIVAKELNVSLDLLECFLTGNLEVSDALDIMRKMSEVYAVPLNDLWLDADDTTSGLRLFTTEAAESSSRILDRKDRTGQRTPYYEYRDAAMSRCSQFRPEWIKAPPEVNSGDPCDPDVQMNNGHLMMQTTLFIGPVDFYYTDRHGKVHRREMNTGDSNYISPFVPHSFTARADAPEAIIIAAALFASHSLLALALAAVGLRLCFVGGGSAGSARGPAVAMEARKFIVGGNWKANGSPESVKTLVKELNDGELTTKDVEVVCAPPFLYLAEVKDSLRKEYKVAAQNLWDKDPGAWTGEIPAQLLADMGIEWVVLGHSERRENCGETSQIVAEKTKFAVDKGFSTLTCIGEKLDAREGGKTFEVLDEQLKPLAEVLSEADWESVVLAYEPVWAIGTGKVATPEQAEETHAYIRKWLAENVSEKVSESVRIQYGGSVNDKNAAELGQQPNIDGFLVGGASLKGSSFTTIINSAGLDDKIGTVTYGGQVRRAFTELARLGAFRVAQLAGDCRNPVEARKCLLQRRLAAECLTEEGLTEELKASVAAGRVRELLEGEEASREELEALAAVLQVRLSDLLVTPLEDAEEVVVTSAPESRQKARVTGSYVLAPLARTRHQPDLKTFDLEVLATATPGEGLSCGLHTFVYHFGSEPVELTWAAREERKVLLRPGDSAYVAPMVEHRFSVVERPAPAPQANPNGAARGEGRRLFLVRIPGQLSGETLAEFATFSAFGRERVGAETVRWYN
ncbi:unnamed protein product [Effrenium voratum]|uniref:triose-phosphate isomerase n=1 Tax=Effrenium voratum TaxID=2562239 RepID=A0AA36JD40_9DINO|nr:unnamed protein product [Effrenium voratum]